MILKHGDYLSYEFPKNWTAEEDDDNLLIYNPDGNGSVTVSFFNILDSSVFLDEYVSIFAKKFIDKNNIKMHSPLILLTKEGKTVLSGTGTESDGWFIKLWVVAKYPKIVFATYLSERKNREVKICDSIIESMKFIL